MRFAKLTFTIAGIWGLLVIPPCYFLEQRIGREQPPAITHPEYFYGFVGVALAWQIAFLIIGRDPVRYRPLMLACMVEKFSFAAACTLLYFQRRIATTVLFMSMVDLCLGVAFVIAYAQTASNPGSQADPLGTIPVGSNRIP